MVLGSTKHWKLYIVEKSNDLISAKTFTDYSGYVIDWQVEGGLNSLATLDCTFIDIRAAQAKLDVSKGNIIYLMSKQTLLGKFVIQKQIFRNDGTVQVTGIQSTGTEKVNRKLQQENMPKIKYDNVLTCDILCSECNTCQGILVDSAEQKVLTLDSGHPGSASDRFAVEYDNENRIEAISKLAGVTGQEWWIEHGTNDATPYSEGDTLALDDRKGTATSTYTFYVGNGVGTQNCQISQGGEEVETNINDVRVEGIDQANNQIISCAHDSQGVYTYIPSANVLDGWLKDDISDGQSGSGDPGETYIDLVAGSMGGLLTEGIGSGESATLRIDNERIFIDAISNACGWPRLTIDCRDCTVTCTEGVPHIAGADVSYQARTPGNVRLYVDCTSKLCPTGYIQVGSEKMSNCGICSGYVQVERTWRSVYAHGKCVKVCSGEWEPANPANELLFNATVGSFLCGETICGLTSCACAVTIDNPSACVVTVCDVVGNFVISETVCSSVALYGTLYLDYSQNSIQQNGIYSKTISNNSPKNRHNLDMVSQRILETKKLPIKRITLTPQSPFDSWDTVSLGDLVTLGDGSEIGFSNGEEVRITGYMYQFKGGLPLVEYYCNDPDTRTYASNQNNYVEQKQETERAKQQDPLRKASQFEEESTSYGVTGSWGSGLKRLTDVQSPTDDLDAANKKYVDACAGGGGAGKWCDNSGGITPISDKDLCMKSNILFDADNTYDIGTSSKEVSAGYFDGADISVLSVDYINSKGTGTDIYFASDCNIRLQPGGAGGVVCVNSDVCLGSNHYHGCGSSLSGVVTGIAKGGSANLTGNVYLCEGSNILLSQSGQNITIASTGGGSSFWVDGSNPYIVPCNSCGVCATRLYGTTLVTGLAVYGTDCVCSPTICGTTIVRSPSVYGSNLVCSNTVCGTCYVIGASICGATVCGTTYVKGGDICGTHHGDGSNLSGLVTSISKGGSAQLTGNVYLCEGSNVTLSQSGQNITIASTGGGLWADSTNPYIIPCNSCGICMPGNIYSSTSLNCLGRAASPGAWKEVHSLCVSATTCVCAGKYKLTGNANNFVDDDSSRLCLQGNSGIYLNLNSSGDVCTGNNVSTLRPTDNCSTDLGANSNRWADLYLRDAKRFGTWTVNAGTTCMVGLTVPCASSKSIHLTVQGASWAAVCDVYLRGWGWQSTTCICAVVRNIGASNHSFHLHYVAFPR